MTQVKSFASLNIPDPETEAFVGEKISIKKVIGKEITIEKYRIGPSNYQKTGTEMRLDLQIIFMGEKRLTWTNAKGLQETIKKIPYPEGFPFTTTIISENDRYYFR